MFPKINVDLTTLDKAGLEALKREFAEQIVAQKGKSFNADQLEELRAGRAKYDEIVAALAALATAEAEDAERQAEADSLADIEVDDDASDEGDSTESDLSDDGDAVEDDDDDETDDDDDDDDDEEVEASVATKPRRKPVTTAPAATTEELAPVVTNFRAPSGVPGIEAGAFFDDSTQLAGSLLDLARDIRPEPGRRHLVGVMQGNFAEDRILSKSPLHNLQKLTGRLSDDELTAAVCGPLTPVYDLACRNNVGRPVYNSLPGYQYGDRGGVSIPQSPTLQDVAPEGIGTGIWTQEDDAENDEDPAHVKNPCATIECGTPEEYRWYAVYRCIVVKNMLAMTNPELLDAYLNRLEAAQARLAEVQLLEQMSSNASPVIYAGLNGYGATTQIMRSLLRYRAARREIERWDDVEFNVWAHRRYLDAIKIDLFSQRRTDGGPRRIPSTAEVNAMFASEGFNVTWTLDSASWMEPIAPMVNGADIANPLPSVMDMLVAPRGKLRLMDQGTLNLGVAGSRIRDTGLLAANAFEIFFESFEGVVDTDSCPSHLLSLRGLCWTGHQIADVEIDCEGDDYLGVGSD